MLMLIIINVVIEISNFTTMIFSRLSEERGEKLSTEKD
jgi:hypothetical protein